MAQLRRTKELLMTTQQTATSLRKPARALVISCLLLAGAVAAHQANAADEASAFIADLGRHAIAIVKNPEISKTDRQRQFEALMAEDFDLPKIAQFVLGSNWQTATETQRQQFTIAFGGYMTGVYSQRFAAYNAGSFHVTTEIPAGERTTVVNSEITRIASGEAIDLNWVVAKTPGGYKVIDITADGMSLSQAQRDEFSSVVRRNGGNLLNLIRQLQVKSTELSDAVP
jgi:phospholipid transport system substrate-binding protein